MEGRPPLWRVAANILNKQLRTDDKGWTPDLGLGEVLTTTYPKTGLVTNWIHLPRA